MTKFTHKVGWLAFCLAILTLCGFPGTAAALPIGTLSGIGSIVVDQYGNPTGTYSFAGTLSWDDTIPFYGGQTLAEVMDDHGQYYFSVNSLGGLPAFDMGGVGNPVLNVPGTFNWVIDMLSNPGNPTEPPIDSRAYGDDNTFLTTSFTPGPPDTGTFIGSVSANDASFHWSTAYDGDPGGMTALAALGLSNLFTFSGSYTVIDDADPNIGFSVANAAVTASAVPLPPTVWLLGSVLTGLGIWRRRALARQG